MPDPKPERPDLDDYLKSDDIIDFDDSSIEEASEQLIEGLKDNISKAQAIFEFVRDQIFHSFQISATSVTLKASEVLDKGHGICYAKAHLLTAMMRAAGIPAGLCYQIIRDESDDRLVVHGLSAIYIEEIEKWIRLDASKGIEEINTFIDFDRELPGLTVNTEIGEQDDPTIYILPSKQVIKALRKSQTVDELRNNLPDKI